jgi:3-deoxy-manno-octulosonate cytidylyltransferase (CMP-KDO synthetase)
MLEQLRALWNGATIHVAEACAPAPAGVDTAEDLEQLRRQIAQGG